MDKKVINLKDYLEDKEIYEIVKERRKNKSGPDIPFDKVLKSLNISDEELKKAGFTEEEIKEINQDRE